MLSMLGSSPIETIPGTGDSASQLEGMGIAVKAREIPCIIHAGNTIMIVEQRRYTLLPGRIADYFTLYETKGMPVQLRYLPDMLGYYASEIGDLNQVVHLWGHESLDAREHNRNAMRADTAFQDYWHEVRTLIVSQRTEILKPAPFFTARLDAMKNAARTL